MVLSKMERSSARSTSRCAPLPPTAAVLSFRERWRMISGTSEERKEKSLWLLRRCLLERKLLQRRPLPICLLRSTRLKRDPVKKRPLLKHLLQVKILKVQ
ncbi:surface protease GP63 [Trypanosoma cruzi]|nr:surface protease GP63 [Trypanosoma cruzi]